MSIWDNIVNNITGSEAVYNTSDEPDWEKMERKGIEPAGRDSMDRPIWTDKKGRVYYYGDLPRKKVRTSDDEDGGVVNSEVLNNSGGNGRNTQSYNQGYAEYGKPVNYGAPEGQDDHKVVSRYKPVLDKRVTNTKDVIHNSKDRKNQLTSVPADDLLSKNVLDRSQKPTKNKMAEQLNSYNSAIGKKHDGSSSSQSNSTGTALYTLQGHFLGTLASDYPFEIHFIDDVRLTILGLGFLSENDLKRMLQSMNRSSSQKRNEFTEAVRSISAASISKASIESLRPIVQKSMKMGKYGTELGFYPQISSDRKMYFIEFEVPSADYRKKLGDNVWNSTQFPMKSTVNYYYEHGGEQLIGVGHTHVAEFYNTATSAFGGQPYNKQTKTQIFENYRHPSSKKTSLLREPGDLDALRYQNMINFIAFPGGLTIYNPGNESYQSYPFEFFNEENGNQVWIKLD